MEATVEYNYAAQEPDELTLRKGDIIKDIRIMPGGWWQGSIRDKRGMFPDNFVKVIEASSSTPELRMEPQEAKREEVTIRNGSSGRKWCNVLFSYEPCNEDELGLVPQDTIEFLGEVEEGWWSGRLRGRIGVFPSNFVSPPTPEESERHPERDTKELCRVLFPYTAANEDELTLDDGDIVSIISRDAPDKGWWKGELRGKVGLFPDNFVELINSDTTDPGQELWQDGNQGNTKSTNSTKQSQIAGKRSERAHVRKRTETRATNSVRQMTAVTPFMSGEKKSIGNHTPIVKRLTDKSSSIATDNNAEDVSGHVEINEELDGVEREEDAPLLHLTALRAKAPRRRLPSSHHVRNQTGHIPTITNSAMTSSLLKATVLNGTIDTVDQSRDEESENLVGRTRRKAPWIEELILNQMEKKKSMPTDKVDKPEVAMVRKEKIYPRSPVLSNIGANVTLESCQVNCEIRGKDKEKETAQQRTDLSHLTSPVSPNVAEASTPAYVPYQLYYQLLDRVTALQERQTVLERTVSQLSEQMISQLANSSSYK